MKKRLAILIAAAMLITSMPFYAFADDSEPVVKEENSSEEVTGPVVTTGEGSDGLEAGTDDTQPADPDQGHRSLRRTDS